MVALGILVPSVSVRIAAVQQKKDSLTESFLLNNCSPLPSPLPPLLGRGAGGRSRLDCRLGQRVTRKRSKTCWSLPIWATNHTKNSKNVLVTALPGPEEGCGGKEEEEEHGNAAHNVSVTHKEGFTVKKLYGTGKGRGLPPRRAG